MMYKLHFHIYISLIRSIIKLLQKPYKSLKLLQSKIPFFFLEGMVLKSSRHIGYKYDV